MADEALHRIGEFAQRVGVSPELLRAWERRYGLLAPVRSPGGYRLYSAEDAKRVRRMRRRLEDGLSASEAARAALAPGRRFGGLPAPGRRSDGLPTSGRRSDGLLRDAAARLLEAIAAYDEAGVHAVLDESFEAFGLEAVLRDLLLPTLTQVGVGWDSDSLRISQEHFASNLIRGRLLSLARLWSRGRGPLAILACAPGEAHDITLLAFGLLLRSHGWRILFLGANTPTATLAETARATSPAIAVLASFDPALLEAEAPALRRLGQTMPLVLSGPGASDALCASVGARRLNGDLLTAASELAHATPG
jgi:DNA-binding transcriptional MerR regulator